MRTGHRTSESTSSSALENYKEDEKMNCIISLLAGICIGVPLGWAVLFCLVTKDIWPKEPKSKEEWKVM